MLRSVDSAALASYCQSFARWVQAEETVTREGQTINEPVVNRAGDVVGYKIKRHPSTIIAKDEKTSMMAAAARFGFDPSSRTRIHVGEPMASDPFADFLAMIPQDSNEADNQSESREVPN